MDVNLWGPPFWFILHTITMNYPDKPSYVEKRHHFDFFNNLQYVLPCDVCREHYRANFKKNPIESYLDNKKSLVEWGVRMHNEVNLMSGKSAFTTEQVVKKYLSLYNNGDGLDEQQKKVAEFLYSKMAKCECEHYSKSDGEQHHHSHQRGGTNPYLITLAVFAMLGVSGATAYYLYRLSHK